MLERQSIVVVVLLLGGCFLSVGLFLSSLTKNQIVAGVMTFAVFLMLWIINWFADSVGPTGRVIVGFLSITEHLDDFTKGIIDTKHLVYYLSFITFGLFLTAIGAWRERWKLGQSAGLLPRVVVDLSRPRDRKIMGLFIAGSLVFLLLSAIGSYHTYHFTESVTFCGQ